MPALSGLSAFPLTPADTEGRVNLPALQSQLQHLLSAGVDSIGLLGSTGTYMYLTAPERLRATQAAAEVCTDRLLIGIGALTTRDALVFARAARQAGAAAGLLALPAYTPLTAAEIVTHVQRVSEDSGLPLVIYDNPSTTHHALTPQTLQALAALPGVIAVKNPAPSLADLQARLAQQKADLPKHVQIGFSGDWFGAEALLAGAATWYSVAAGLLPEACLALTRAAQSGDPVRTRALDAKLAPLWDLFRTHGSLRVMYAMAEALGRPAGPPPAPLLPLSAGVGKAVALALENISIK